MKNAKEFIKEMENNEALKKELKAINEPDALLEFLEKNGVSTSLEDFAEAVKTLMVDSEEGKISDEAAEAVAGGLWPFEKNGGRSSGDGKKHCPSGRKGVFLWKLSKDYGGIFRQKRIDKVSSPEKFDD